LNEATNLTIDCDSGDLTKRWALWAVLEAIEDDRGTGSNSSAGSLPEMLAGGIFIAILARDTYAASLKLCDGL
jgi:hypothetical protein